MTTSLSKRWDSGLEYYDKQIRLSFRCRCNIQIEWLARYHLYASASYLSLFSTARLCTSRVRSGSLTLDSCIFLTKRGNIQESNSRHTAAHPASIPTCTRYGSSFVKEGTVFMQSHCARQKKGRSVFGRVGEKLRHWLLRRSERSVADLYE